jgi:AraC family transcriptional regulator, transcriptional activator of pobA
LIHYYESTLDFTTEGLQIPVAQNYIHFSFPGKLETWKPQGRRYGYAIFFSPAFAGLDITSSRFDETYPYFNLEAQATLALDQDEAQALKRLSDEMIEEAYSDRTDRWVMIHKLLHVYLSKIRRFYKQHIDQLPVDTKANQTLFNRFRNELDGYFQDLAADKASSMPTVSTIAHRLQVNANYLNGTLKKITGRTASSYIQDKMMLEAKAYLLHSDIQIAEIAYKLGFGHVSYFNRFFKKHAHYTPVEFRNSFNLYPSM